MSNELYNRVAILKIGPSEKNLLNPRKYEGFRIAFEIGKTTERNPNTSRISIYNLKYESAAELEKSDLKVILEVGYRGFGDGPALTSEIFVGDITTPVKTERSGPDLITTIEAGDSEKAITETVVNESFPPNTSSTSVIQSLAQKFGTAVGTIMPGLGSIFENGLSLTGLASDSLDMLTKKDGLEWSITDGELNILDPALATPETAVLVSAATGLIGVPSKSNDTIQFESLINPLIKPGRAVSLVSKKITGVFKVTRCVYNGDTHQGDWKMVVEAK